MLCELYFDRPLLTRSFFKHGGEDFLLWHDHDLSLSEKSQAVIYLYRNPIDTVFSQIKYHNQNFDDPATILQWTDLYGSHLTKWIYTETFTQRKMVVGYEDLVQNPLKVFQRLSAFYGYRYDPKRAKQVLNHVTKKVVQSKTINHDPQVQQISPQYETLRSEFRRAHAAKIWDRLTSRYPHAGVAFGRLPQHERPEAVTTSNTTKSKNPADSKIIGLVTVRNEEQIIAQCLKALARFTDAIVILDDASDDSTVSIIKSLRRECNVEKIITKDTWHRDEPGDRNLLLDMGRKLNGTHFIVLDADEMFTANLQYNNFLRNQILALNPGDSICLVWICLWRSVLSYRYDNSVWSNNYKPFIFADDAQSVYRSDFIHTGRTPTGLKGKQHIIRGYNFGVLHFQFANWSNLLIKQAWYRCLERIRQPEKPCTEINQLYAPSKDEKDLGLREAPFKWFCGYDFFDASAFTLPDQWRHKQILAWFEQYGHNYFRELDIWDIDWNPPSGDDESRHLSGSELDTDDQTNRCGLSIAEIVEREEFEEAETILKDEITRSSEPWEAYRLLIDCLIHAGKASAIMGYLQPLIDRMDLPAEVDATIGSGFEAAGNLDLAIQFAERASRKADHCACACNLQGIIAYRQGHCAAAARHFQKASFCDPHWGDPWTNQGTLHWEQSEKSQALDCFEKGVTLSPTSPHIADAYYGAILDTQSITRALPVLKKICRTHPHFKKIHLLYIDALIRAEAFQTALNAIRGFVGQFGDHQELLELENAIGQMLNQSVGVPREEQSQGDPSIGARDKVAVASLQPTIVALSSSQAPRP